MNLYRNEKLLAAFDLYARQQDALLPTEEELSAVTLSPEFHTKMKRLLTLRKRGYYVLFGTVGRQVASVLVALLLALTTATVSVKAWRESVLNFFSEVFDTHAAVTFASDTAAVAAASEGFVPRTPTDLPAGYAIGSEEAETDRYTVAYVHANGRDTLRYNQSRKCNYFLIDTECGSYTEITVNGREGVFVSNKETTVLLFADDTYTYWLSGPCTAEELIRTAESIQ